MGKKEQGEKVEFKMKSPKGQWPLKNECDMDLICENH